MVVQRAQLAEIVSERTLGAQNLEAGQFLRL